ncbi:LPS assembly lipoprotein LptE [Photobacterium sanctipauli]|nr:LPS assembly lipoprotein LptE [Photobacterium sanctipauli]
MALATASCGFHLRGNYMLPDDIAKLSLTSFDRYGELHRQVKSQFKLHGIEPVPPSANVPNLHLISESTGERTLSLYQNARAAEYELTYTVRYRVVVPNKGSQSYTSRVNRTFLDNPLTALAKSVERDMIEDEMRQQASRQIMRQLARLTAAFDQMEADELESLLEESANEEGISVTTEEDGDRDGANQIFNTTSGENDASAASNTNQVNTAE